MVKFKQLSATNFQVHKKQVLQFSPGISTLVGPTDSGKSAILRALRWICLNDFAGDDFVREGAKETEVGLVLSGGETVTRFKGRSNLYTLGEKEFKAFGATVPEDVADLLQTSALNFQSQHDSPFWFNETAGEVSRQLNSVVDLQVIDSTLFNLGAEVRTAHERVRLVDERLAEAKEEMAELEPQRARVKQFQKLEESQRALHGSQSARNELDELLTSIRKKRFRIKRREEKHGEGTEVVSLGKQAREAAVSLADLGTLIGEIKVAKATRTPPDFSQVERIQGELTEVEQRRVLLRGIASNAITQLGRVQTARNKVQEAEEQFHKQTHGKNCPTCLQSLSQS